MDGERAYVSFGRNISLSAISHNGRPILACLQSELVNSPPLALGSSHDKTSVLAPQKKATDFSRRVSRCHKLIIPAEWQASTMASFLREGTCRCLQLARNRDTNNCSIRRCRGIPHCYSSMKPTGGGRVRSRNR